MGERRSEGEKGGEGGGYTGGLVWWWVGGVHQRTAAKLMPSYSFLRHRGAECGGSLTESGEDAGGESGFVHAEDIYYNILVVGLNGHEE